MNILFQPYTKLIFILDFYLNDKDFICIGKGLSNDIILRECENVKLLNNVETNNHNITMYPVQLNIQRYINNSLSIGKPEFLASVAITAMSNIIRKTATNHKPLLIIRLTISL